MRMRSITYSITRFDGTPQKTHTRTACTADMLLAGLT
jgi:hypothetical protein